MDMFLSLSGMLGAACCVGMYVAVSLGKAAADRPAFFLVNAAGSMLILMGAAHQFDVGDLGTVGQEVIWAVVSLFGAGRAWWRHGGAEQAAAWRARLAPSSFACLAALA